MAGKKKNTGGIWHIVDSLQGDKVIWMIVLTLILISILAISSSTPLLALQSGSSRNSIIREQLFVVTLGLGAIIALYNFKWTDWIMKLSKWGFLFSFLMLIFLFFKLDLGVIKAVEINHAVRAISIFGFQLHVFEFTKVLMIMYLAWAIDAYKRDDLPLLNRLSQNEKLGFLVRPKYKLFFYIYLPILTVCVLILNGSVSSAVFIGMIMFALVIIGGISIKTLFPYIGAAVVILILCIGVYNISDGKKFKRIGTATERISRHREDPIEELKKLKPGTQEFQDYIDKTKQPVSAKIAISEGGLLGKGVGRSTQRYVVPIMFEDYMFSFIVEEYGIFGALLVIILYSSLLARGSLIVKQCEKIFEKTAIAGLVIVISGQAFLHMLINVDLGPLTGQTLPLISHGNSSFLAFCIAFGIILSISRVAKKRMDKIAKEAEAIAYKQDDIKEGLNELDQLESI